MFSLKRFCILMACILAGTVAFSFQSMADWRTASREPVGIAPEPKTVSEAVVQVYAARAYSWRGIFGVHTWIATKEENAEKFRNYEVLGWRVRRGMAAVAETHRAPDSRWFGATPEILADIRGPKAAGAIRKIQQAVKSYPYNDRYVVWPGPNSNTFIAHIARQVPELKLDLPATAIGKDYLPNDHFIASSPSGTGAQLSVKGLFGLLVGWEEGIEINILGLTFGLDPNDLAIKLPLAGKIGP